MTESRPIFLDTTIKVDSALKENHPHKQTKIDALLERFDERFVCSFSRLEFKRVVLQNMSLALEYVIEGESFFAAFVRATLLRDRKAKILSAILAWTAQMVDVPSDVPLHGKMDQELRMRSESYLRNAIQFLWFQFVQKTTLLDATNCQRAKESPKRRPDGSFDLTIHVGKCKTRSCNNAGFFQAKLPLIDKLCTELRKCKKEGVELTAELETSLAAMEAAKANFGLLNDYQTCLKVGDVWMHLEAIQAKIKDFATTNHKESTRLCQILGLEMHNPYAPVVDP